MFGDRYFAPRYFGNRYWGEGLTGGGSDTTPDQFAFTDQSGVALLSTITSAPVTVTGINASTTASATGGTIDVDEDGNFQASRTVVNGSQVRARHTSSASYLNATDTTVTIGGISDVFRSTTQQEAADSDIRRKIWGRYARTARIRYD